MAGGVEETEPAGRSDQPPLREPDADRSDFRDHDVRAGRARIRLTEWLPRTEPAGTVVLLPGVLAPRSSFARLALQLQSAFRVIAVDLPGFGESEKPSPSRYPYDIVTFADGIVELFGAMGLSRAHVLGHGLGGAVALRLAAHRAELVESLALVAPLAHPTPGTGVYRLLSSPIVGSFVLRQLLGQRTFRRLYSSHVNSSAPLEVIDAYYEALASPASRAALRATLANTQDTRGVIADSRRVRAPALIVWGRGDRLFPLDQGRRLSREMPRAGLELIDSGHAPHEEAPEQTARVLSRFFAGKRPGLS